MNRGLFLGRFQPFHNGHLYMIETARGQVDELIVAIGSAEKSHTDDNPFTAGERILMIRETLIELEWLDKIIIVPIRDMNRYGIWVNHIEEMVPKFDIVFASDVPTIGLFQEKGYRAQVLTMKNRKYLSGMAIREIMATGNTHWEEYVPPGSKGIIQEIDGMDRIRNLRGEQACQ